MNGGVNDDGVIRSGNALKDVTSLFIAEIKSCIALH